jgi:hypothetical protein
MSITSASPLASALTDDALRQRRTNVQRYMQWLLAAAEAAEAARAKGEPAPVPDARAMAQLRTLAAALGKSPRDVEADTRVLELVASHRRRIAEGRGMGEPAERALAAAIAYREAGEAIATERQAELTRLWAAHAELKHRDQEGWRAANDITDLCAEHRELLQDLERPARKA